MLNKKQLVWRCRRGIRELDVLFDKFLASDYSSLNDTEKEDFERFLEVQDPVIMDWLVGKYPPEDSGLKVLVERLRLISGLR